MSDHIELAERIERDFSENPRYPISIFHIPRSHVLVRVVRADRRKYCVTCSFGDPRSEKAINAETVIDLIEQLNNITNMSEWNVLPNYYL